MTIAVAYGETARDKAALHEAAGLAVLRREALAVLRIVAGADQPAPDPKLTEKIGSSLLSFSDLKWDVHTAPEEFDTAEALLTLADGVDATMLVIGGRKRTAVGKLLLGSTVQRVLLEATIPVLVVKAT